MISPGLRRCLGLTEGMVSNIYSRIEHWGSSCLGMFWIFVALRCEVPSALLHSVMITRRYEKCPRAFLRTWGIRARTLTIQACQASGRSGRRRQAGRAWVSRPTRNQGEQRGERGQDRKAYILGHWQMHNPIRAHIKALHELGKSSLKNYLPDRHKLSKASRMLRGLPHCTA